MQASEQELIAHSLAKDAISYGELVERYKDSIYRCCYAIVRDENAAEDIAQDTFIAAYYKLHTYNQARKFSTWLFAIATNKSLNYARRNRHLTTLEQKVADVVQSPHATPHEQAVDAEVRQAVALLPPKYRGVIHMYYFEHMEYEQVAESMAVPVGTVKAWLFRAKKQLRKELT